MKKTLLTKNVSMFILIAFCTLVACAPTSQLQVKTTGPDSTAQKIYTITPVQPTASAIAVPSPMSTQKLTSTPIILSESEKDIITNLMLQDNGNCDAPCFFGMKPGETTFEEVEKSIMPVFGQGVVQSDSKGRVSSYGGGFETEKHIRGDFVIYFEVGIVSSIRVHIGNMYKPEVQSEDWSAFTLPGILSRYGVPSNVEFFVDTPHEPVSNPGVMITYKISYDDLNTEVFYFGDRIDEEEIYHLCLSEQKPEFMRLNINELEETESSGIQLEEATSLTNEMFYELFVKDEGKCLDLRLDSFIKSE